MAKIYNSVDELIGGTPLLRMRGLEKEYGLKAALLAKLEYFNPTGSAKDRVALKMINDAEASGTLKPTSVIIEPTSGNTGIGLAAVAAARGYRAIIVMPDTMSIERIKLMRAYGAEVVLSEGELGMAGCIKKADEIAANTPDSFIAGQFVNPSNPCAHYVSTGPEIWKDTDGKVDIFVAGIGTGGTITGTGEYLKEKNPDIKVIGVEPAGSPVLTQGHGGAHGIQGIGAGFIPEVLNTKVCDEVLAATETDSYAFARLIGKREGVLVGISSGCAAWAAVEVAKRPENEGKTIVVLLPDTGDRYLSSDLFE